MKSERQKSIDNVLKKASHYLERYCPADTVMIIDGSLNGMNEQIARIFDKQENENCPLYYDAALYMFSICASWIPHLYEDMTPQELLEYCIDNDSFDEIMKVFIETHDGYQRIGA